MFPFWFPPLWFWIEPLLSDPQPRGRPMVDETGGTVPRSNATPERPRYVLKCIMTTCAQRNRAIPIEGRVPSSAPLCIKCKGALIIFLASSDLPARSTPGVKAA